MKRITYGKQNIDEGDIEEVIKALKSDYLTTGPRVQDFEKSFAGYVGAKHAVAVSNGTAALHLACLVLEFSPGDEVITTPMTFAASANCVLYVGAKPVFADIDERTYNIDPQEIKGKITSNTKAVIPVHYTGLPCSMKEINALAKEHNIFIIEDACHALGAEYEGTRIGDCCYSDMTVFSFHPVKHITTGEGGMITTNSKELYEKLLILRSHGINRDPYSFEENHGGWYYEMQTLGYNYRLTDFQCALGLSQLKRIESNVARRKELAKYYSEKLIGLPLTLPIEPLGYSNSFHLYIIALKDDVKDKREEFYNYLRDAGIFTQVHYIPVHLQPYYRQNFAYKKGDYPKAENHYERILSLPLYPTLTNHEIEYVINKIREFFL